MMRNVSVTATAGLVIFTLHAQAQKVWESEGINPELCYRLPIKEERAYINGNGHPRLFLEIGAARTPE